MGERGRKRQTSIESHERVQLLNRHLARSNWYQVNVLRVLPDTKRKSIKSYTEDLKQTLASDWEAQKVFDRQVPACLYKWM